jgi:transcription initiation factor TFIID subunit 12
MATNMASNMAPNGSVPMIRPQNIDSLPHLDSQQKQTYKQGLLNLWNAYDNNAEGSQARMEAKSKIVNASRKIMQQLGGGQRPAGNAAPQQAQAQQQAQQSQRPPQAQQPGAQNVQTPGVQQAGAQGQQNPQQMQQQQQQQRPQAQQQPPQMQQPPQAQQQAGPPDQVAQLQAKVKQMVQNLIVFPEPNTANSTQFEQYKLSFQQGLGTSILKRERARGEITRLEQLETQMKGNGQALSDDLVNRLNGARTAFADASRSVGALEQKNEQNKQLYNQKQARNKEMQQGQPAGQQVNGNGQQMANQQVNGGQAQTMQRTTSQQAQANVGQGDVKMEQPQHSPAPPQFSQQQQQQVPTPQAGTPVQQQQQMPPQQQQQQARPQPQQGTPQSATQPQQQFPQNTMPQPQQQQRPPMGQQQAQQYGGPQNNMPQQPQHQQHQQTPQQQQQQQQYQQTPQSAMQQNNTPNQQQPPQQPHALTQRDAMARSAQSYSQQQQQGPNVNQPQQPMQQQHGNMPNGLPFNNQPQSAQQHTPTSGFPPTQQMNSAQTKFPIPKDLRMDPRTQAPVAGPPSRPTMMGQGGMMNVPGVQKPAHFTLEGEGDHVLSKRKLDELVRQITGSVSPEDGLSPEVEEAVLALTDNFVDNVVQKACALAKLRQGQTLEVKDIQMVLERNYGIRIPGYSLDELRTVRKFQPAPGWVGKVQAVQAGKVMGGNKDA